MNYDVLTYIKKLIKKKYGKYPMELIFDFDDNIIGFITNNLKAYDLKETIIVEEIKKILKETKNV